MWVRARLCILLKGCTRLAAASDKVYQLLAHGRWFSPGTPVSSTTKTGRHDIAEILLKVALSTINQIKSKKDIRLLYPGCYKLMFYDTDHKKTFIFWISCCFFLNKHSRRIHVLVICLYIIVSLFC